MFLHKCCLFLQTSNAGLAKFRFTILFFTMEELKHRKQSISEANQDQKQSRSEANMERAIQGDVVLKQGGADVFQLFAVKVEALLLQRYLCIDVDVVHHVPDRVKLNMNLPGSC